MKVKKKFTILYVEDDALARASVVSILREFYHNIIEAGDGFEALDLYQQQTIDLVITDIDLPGMNGIELIRKLKTINSDLYTIIISAYSDKEHLLEGIKSGITDYFIKPLQVNELLHVIDKLAQKTEKIRQEEEEKCHLKQYREITDRSSMITHVDREGKILQVNQEFVTVTGYTQKELLGEVFYVGNSNEFDNIFLKLLASIQERKTSWQGIIRNKTKDQQHYYTKTTIMPIIEQNQIQEYIVSQTTITDVIHPKQQFFDYIESLQEAYVVLIKIENFKYFENTIFKQGSQNYEQKIADEIFTRLPKICAFPQIYILGNGEFALVENLDRLPNNANRVTAHLYRFQNSINQEEITLEDVEYTFSILMSIAYGKNAFEDAKVGLNRLVGSTNNFILANGFKQEKDHRLEQLKFLKKAIDNYRVVSYFQPIVNNRTLEIEKYESLVRFMDEKENIFSPYYFLELAKEGKCHDQITTLVLKNSFEALAKTDKSIAINFSALDFEKESTQEQFMALLNRHQADATRIIIELTEDESVENFDTIKRFIHAIKAYGVKIAIDDFGAGYSNFERVLDYEPNILKIDGKLTRSLQDNAIGYSIVESIVNFAKKENLQIIAEQVEDKATYELLYQMGVDYSQGYYFGKPDKLEDSVCL